MIPPEVVRAVRGNPLGLMKFMWPEDRLYDKQREVVESVRQDHETFVVAANKTGKDWIAGKVIVSFFAMPQVYFDREYVAMIERDRGSQLNPHFVRIVATSVADRHLDVLWGEVEASIQSCKYPLTVDKGGIFRVIHHEILKLAAGPGSPECAKSYFKAMVYDRPEKMQGHHAPYTLFVGDEASGLEDAVHDMANTWAKRKLVFGNARPCENFFRRGVEEGTLTQGAAT